MTVAEIIKEIDRLPNFYYCFYFNNRFHSVILGGHPSRTRDEYEYASMDYCDRLFKDMEALYEKECLTDDDKESLARKMQRMTNTCDYRHVELRTLKAQEDYLSKLSAEALEEISSQVQMYKTAREYFRIYVHGK